jgi:ferritin
MISDSLAKSINEQIANELYASNSYLQIAAYFDGLGLKVLAAFFFTQSDEERVHATKLLKYLLEVGKKVKFGAIKAGKADYKSPEDAIQTALDQEIVVTNQINALMKEATTNNDYATQSFLKWFVDEQVEEVASMSDLLQLVKLAGEERILLVEDRLLRAGGVTLDAKEGE